MVTRHRAEPAASQAALASRRALVMLFVFLVGCAHQQPADSIDIGEMPTPVAQIDRTDEFWWYARFEMDWGEKPRADFSQNLIIAREVIAPLLIRHDGKIMLWRFHRRAAHDEAGHQFSFIFYATPAAAKAVYDDIRADSVVEALQSSGDLIELKLDDPAVPRRNGIAGASDPNWPQSIQNSWPYFIMGVSLMWLDLVAQSVDVDELDVRSTIPARLGYYREVHDRITRLWKQVGRHALFHHINAIYGYEPLEITF